MKNFNILFTLILIVAGLQVNSQTPKLNSYIAARPTIFLDFDGQTVRSTGWNSGNTLTCAPSTMTSTQITDIFNRVSEDFRPFNVNITTDSTVFLSAPLNKRIRIIVTPTSGWTSGVGGISYVGSFTWGDDTPAFVFQDRLQNNPKYVAECCSHETGHALGLTHQSAYDATCRLVATYAEGTGSGETGWAPIMGNSYYKNMTGWNDGPTPYGCSNIQDNLTIITSQNGFGYRTDDFTAENDATATLLNNASFATNGIIETNTDKDAFRIALSNTRTIRFQVNPFAINTANVGANLDIRVDLYNNSNVLLKSYDKIGYLDVSIDTTLSAGTYYFVISGTGNANIDDYGSIGAYTISGFAAAPLPIHDITLRGNVDRRYHNVNWNIVADEPIEKQIIEVSDDGIIFKQITELPVTTSSYAYAPNFSGTMYYRLKVTSVIGQTAYSNIVALRSTATSQSININTITNSDVTVNAGNSYEFILMDMNGRMMSRGRGNAGITKINMQQYSSGMYIIQFLTGNRERQTERIIKQ